MAELGDSFLVKRNGCYYRFNGTSTRHEAQGTGDDVAYMRAYLEKKLAGDTVPLFALLQVEYTTDYNQAGQHSPAYNYAVTYSPSQLFEDRSCGGLLECAKSASGRLIVGHGQGVLADAISGVSLYSGAWDSGFRHGRGIASLRDANGRALGVYEGDWFLGMRHGNGTIHEEGCGMRWEGAWALDRRHGPGLETIPGGGSYRGVWYEGSLVRALAEGLMPEPTLRSASSPTYESLMALLPQGEGCAGASSMLPSRVPRSIRTETGAEGDLVGLALDLPRRVEGASGVHFSMQLPSSGTEHAQASGDLPSVTLNLNADVVRLLKHSSVSDLPRARSDVITVDAEDNLSTTLTRMTERNVLSLPVRDATSGKYTAVVHLLDVCAFLLDLVAKKGASFSPVAGGLREMMAHQQRFALSTVSQVLRASTQQQPSAFRPLPSGSPLIFAAYALAEGVHAIPIVDTEGHIVRMLTQGDLVRFLAAHVDEVGPLGQVTIRQLLPGLAQRVSSVSASGIDHGASGALPDGSGGVHGELQTAPLIVATFSDKAMDVLQRLRTASCPAAAVVDTYGAMVANLSLSDLKAVARKANFSALALPVQSFLAALDRGSELMNPSIVVRAGTPLSSVLLTLAATRIHQLYFVDELLRPIAAIRTGDVLRVMVGSPQA